MDRCGRKKVVGELAPSARDPRDVETIKRLQQWIQELGLQHLRPDLPVEEAKLSLTSGMMSPWTSILMAKKKPRYVNRLYQPRRNDHVVDRDDRYRDDLIRSLGLKTEIPEFIALKVEKHIKANSKGSTSRFTSCFTLPTRTASPIAPKRAPKATTPTTSAAGNTKEHVDNAPHFYKCSELRHYARDCSNLKTLAFIPDDACLIYDTDAEPGLDEPGDEMVYPNRE
nr:reverse transcriptase domain-containing protein [Tanacetum cinerariifolium]